MFTFNRQLLADAEFVRIVNDKNIILYDEYPILFVGENTYGLPIIGSYIAHDQEADDDVVYFIHLVVSNNAYQSFSDGRVTYRELLEASENIYITEKNYDQKTEKYYLIPSTEFPRDYLPLPESHFPRVANKPGLEYNVSLEGGLADENKAIPSQASNVANGFSEILAFNLLSLLNYRVIQRPSTTGSFKINLELQVQYGQGEQISSEKEKVLIRLQNSFLDYCINNLHDEANKVFFRETILNAPDYDALKEQLIQAYRVLRKRKELTSEKADVILLKYLKKASTKLDKALVDMGPNFSSISFHNTNKLHESSLISRIDVELKNKIERTAILVKSDGQDIIEDEELQEYQINIYNLNTDTRVGNAVVFFGTEEHKEMSRPRIKIDGASGLENSKYTESLHSGRSVTVNARGKRVQNKFLSLLISDE